MSRVAIDRRSADVVPMLADYSSDIARTATDPRTSQPDLWLPEAKRLRARGLSVGEIGNKLGHAPATVSAYLPRDLMTLSNYDLAYLRRVACAPEDVARVCEEAHQARLAAAWERRRETKRIRQRERAGLRGRESLSRAAYSRIGREQTRLRHRAWRREFEEWRSALRRAGRGLVSGSERDAHRRAFIERWNATVWPRLVEDLVQRERLRARRELIFAEPNERMRHRPSEVDLAERALVARARRDWWDMLHDARERVREQLREQRARERAQRRYRWIEIPPQRISLDYVAEENFAVAERIADPSSLGRDPLHILTDENPLEEILDGIGLEDIARMDEYQLGRLRERLLEAGISRPGIQAVERERLSEPEPHRGSAPAPQRQRKSPRHRGRNEASALHKTRGKRFVRRNSKKARDGWGEFA